MNTGKYTEEALELLKKLISTPSISKNENQAADIIEEKELNKNITIIYFLFFKNILPLEF